MKKNKPLLILILLFAVPLFLGWWLFDSGVMKNSATVNHGHLIQPVRDFSKVVLLNKNQVPANTAAIKRKWLLVYVMPGACSDQCKKVLHNMRQIHKALGKRQRFLAPVLIVFPHSVNDPVLSVLGPGLKQYVVLPRLFLKFVRGLPSSKVVLYRGYLYLVDPRNNLMISYPVDENPSYILKDLERLMKYSRFA